MQKSLKSWELSYLKLKTLAIDNTEMVLRDAFTSIPKEIRPEFYRLFGETRANFIKEEFSKELAEARNLSRAYIRIEAEVKNYLGQVDLITLSRLHRFLNDPLEELKLELFEPLFQLLKFQITSDGFRDTSINKLHSCFKPLFRQGYEKWMALALIKLLQANDLFQVEDSSLSDQKRFILFASPRPDDAPKPIQSRHMIFNHNPYNKFVTPDYLVYSDKLKAYFALRQEIGNALSHAFEKSTNRKWLTLKPGLYISPGTTLIYIDKNLEDIALIADRDSISRPDIVIEWAGEGSLDEMAKRLEYLDPKAGAYILNSESLEEKKTIELKEKIAGLHFLNTGLKVSDLKPIIVALENIINYKTIAG